MEISLQELLSFNFFSTSKVLAGKRGLENLVTCVTVLDSPDAYKYLKGGDFVITTAYGILHDENIQQEVVRKLAVNGASGLGLKLRFFNYRLPQVMRETADSYNLPIICIPDDYAYTDIYEFITANMISRISGEVKREEDVFKEINESACQDGLVGVLKTLYRWTGLVSAIIFDGHIYAYPDQVSSVFPTDKRKWRKRGDMSSSYSSIYYREQGNILLEWLSAEIREQGQPQGSIILFKGNRDFVRDDYILLDSAVSACAMEIKKIRSLICERRKFRTSFLKSFFAGKIFWKEAFVQAKELNYDLPEEGITVIVSLGDDAVNTMDEQKMNVIDGIVTRCLGTKNIFGFLDNNMVIYLPHKEQHISLLNKLYVEISKNFPDCEVVMGISRPAVFSDVSKSYEEAKSAIHIGTCLNLDTKIYLFGNLGFYRLLKLPDIYEEMVKYYMDYLKPLQDQKNSIDLINTLSYFIENNYNYRKTAEQLYVHPNTIRYRISLIEKICRINLKYAYDRLNMELALKILPLLKIK
ncbi:MAG: PucR family transcriptional regulator ligand-binding domain-containing protein [Syntrophaceticus schinkii]